MNSTIPADLLELKARFENWRTNRKYVREPIPDELWNAAADLSRRYPPSLVGRVLKIDPSRLKDPFRRAGVTSQFLTFYRVAIEVLAGCHAFVARRGIMIACLKFWPACAIWLSLF
jgi:hypothetical protein